MLILVGLRGENVAIFASGLGCRIVSGGLRLNERECDRIHAELIFGRRANPRFGVDCAAQVIVQVGALGHTQQEQVKLERIVAGRLDREGGTALSRGGGLGSGGLHLGLAENARGKEK